MPFTFGATPPVGVARLRQLPGIVGVEASQTASLKLPPAIYAAILLDYSRGNTAATRAQLLSDIATVKLLHGADPVIDLKTAELLEIAAHYGYGIASDGHIVLPLAAPEFTDLRKNFFALAMGPSDTVTLEVALTAEAVNPRLKSVGLIYAENGALRQPFGWIRRVASRGHQATGAGIIEIPDLPLRTPGLGLRGLFISNKTKIDQVEVVKDGVSIWEATESQAEFSQRFNAMRSRPRAAMGSDYFVVDLSGGLAGSVVETGNASDFRLKIKANAAASFDILPEVIVLNSAIGGGI